MRRKYNKSKYYLMIAGTFFLLYFVIMFFSTYMVKEDYRKDYEQHLLQQCSDLKDRFENDNSVVFDDVD